MTAAEILGELQAVGASVEVVNDQLRIEAPRGSISVPVRKALAVRKMEVLARVRAQSGGRSPTQYAADPHPPQLITNYELGLARSRFAEHGTQPAWDDLYGAAELERQQAWCRDTLDAVYRGVMTLAFTRNGQPMAYPRGLVS